MHIRDRRIPAESEDFMKKLYCPYCGELLSNNCECGREAAEERERMIEEQEEYQHNSGFYAFQELIEMYRNER